MIKQLSSGLIDQILRDYPYLQHLNLSQNEIEQIENLERISSLQVLNLSKNKIMAISVGLAYSLNLKELYLSNNHLTSLEGLSNLRDLVVLDVGFNQISELREVVKLKANTNLRELILLGNPLAYKNYGCRVELYRSEIKQIASQIRSLDGETFAECSEGQSPHNMNPISIYSGFKKQRSIQPSPSKETKPQAQIQRMNSSVVNRDEEPTLLSQGFQKPQSFNHSLSHQHIGNQNNRESIKIPTSQLTISPENEKSFRQSLQPNQSQANQSLNSSQTSTSEISTIKQSKQVQSLFYTQLQQPKKIQGTNSVKPGVNVQKSSSVSELDTLKQQVGSLKEMIGIYEQQAVQQQKENFPMQRQQEVVSLEKLVQRWREKVYESLVDKKRYEIIIKDNIKSFNADRDQLIKEVKTAQQECNLSNSKLKALESDQQLLQSQFHSQETLISQLYQENQKFRQERQQLANTVGTLKEFQANSIERQLENFEQQALKLAQMNKKINNLKQMVEVHRLTDNSKETLTKLMVSNRQLKDKNIVLQADLEELQDSLSDSRKLQQQLLDKDAKIKEIEKQLKQGAHSFQTDLNSKCVQVDQLKEELKLQREYSGHLEDEKRQLSKRVVCMEEALKEIKTDCAETLQNKEQVLRSQLRDLESKHQKMTKEKDCLVTQLEQTKSENAQELQQAVEDFKKQLKEKDRQIRTLKSERDSIYGELKATTSSHSFSRVLPQKKNQPANMPREIFRQDEITKQSGIRSCKQSSSVFKQPLDNEQWLLSPISDQQQHMQLEQKPTIASKPSDINRVTNPWSRGQDNLLRRFDSLKKQQSPGMLSQGTLDIQEFTKRSQMPADHQTLEEGEHDAEDLQKREKLEELERLAREALDDFDF